MSKYKPMKNRAEPYNFYDTFRWTAGSDVQKVWRKYGWIPPTEYRNDYLFKSNREATNG